MMANMIPQNCVQNMSQPNFQGVVYTYSEHFPAQEFQEMSGFESSDFSKEEFSSSSGVYNKNNNEIVQYSNLNVDAKEFVPREQHMPNPNVNFSFLTEIPDKDVSYNNNLPYYSEFNNINWDKELLEDDYHNTNIGREPSFDLNDTIAAPVFVPKVNNTQSTNDTIATPAFVPIIDNTESVDKTYITESLDKTYIAESVDKTYITESVDKTYIAESVDKTYTVESENTAIEPYKTENIDINGNKELHLDMSSVQTLDNVEKPDENRSWYDRSDQSRFKHERQNRHNRIRTHENESPKMDELHLNTSSVQTLNNVEKVEYSADKSNENKSWHARPNQSRIKESDKYNRSHYHNRNTEKESSKHEELLNTSAAQNVENTEQNEHKVDKTDGNRSRKGMFDRYNQPRQKEYERGNRDNRNKSNENENGKNEGHYQQKHKFRHSQSFRDSPSRKYEDGNYRQYTNTKKNEEGSAFHSKEAESRAARRQTEGADNQSKFKHEQRNNSKGPSPTYRKNRNQDVPDKKGSTGAMNSFKQETYPDAKEHKSTSSRYDKRRDESDVEHSNTESDKEDTKRKCSDKSFDNERRHPNKIEKGESNQETTKKYANKPAKHPKFKIDDGKLERHTPKSADTPQESFNEEEFRKGQERRSLDSNFPRNKSKAPVSFPDDSKESRPRRSLESSKSFRDRRQEKEFEKTSRDVSFTEKSEKPRDLKHERYSKSDKSYYHDWNEEESKSKRSEKRSSHYWHEDSYTSKRGDRWSYGEQNIVNLFDKQHAEKDAEYRAFLKELEANKSPESPKIQEQNQDLFQMPKEYCLAHCVAEDMRMGSGIAVNFRDTFKSVDHLLNMRSKPGGIAILLEKPSRYLYYLVTKKRSRDKPTYKDFWCSIKIMRNHIKYHKVGKLAIPRLGCGLDRLDWSTVKHIIEFLFKDVPVEIVACSFQPAEETVYKYHSVKISNKKERLVNAKEPILVYFSSMDSHVSAEMMDLNETYKFLRDFEQTPKNFGVVVKTQTDDCVLCGCVVRKNMKESFDFRSFSKGLSEIGKLAKDRGYTSIALQCLKDDSDDLLHQKIITVIVNYLNDVNVCVYTGADVNVSFDETYGEDYASLPYEQGV